MHQSKYKMIMFVLFLAVILLIVWLNQKTLSMLVQFLLQGDIEAILNYIRSFGQYAAVIRLQPVSWPSRTMRNHLQRRRLGCPIAIGD